MDKEKVEVKEMIQSLYRFANILPVWDGEVNDDVAAVFGTMIAETRACSNAFGWVPKPPGGRASITWLVRQLGRGVFNSYRSQLSFTCARAVIYKWKSALEMASLGVAMRKLPQWA
ncbi:hypothetical protein [Massilia horti]|uniref:Uncharacterized protein n=1 Tax=Massilia horti TaxID=2562153 RepID=A0A4Y9T6A4_9BURK|nr:hypothetical protein [Massilia horti]TFW33501.1 hypothetical protein E4O92_06650 [Massilia horti]